MKIKLVDIFRLLKPMFRNLKHTTIVTNLLKKKMHEEIITIQETGIINLYITEILGANSSGCFAHGLEFLHRISNHSDNILWEIKGGSFYKAGTKGCALAVNNHSWLALKG